MPFDWGYFPNTVPAFPKELTDRLIARGEASRHSRQPACLGHRRDRGVRRGAHPHRQADLLHLRRFRLADLRARRAFRAGAALRGLQDRPKALRPAPHRPRHRPAVRRREAWRVQAHRQPQGLRHPAAGRDAARPLRLDAARRLRRRKDLRHFHRARRDQGAQGAGEREPVQPDAGSDARGEGRRPRLHQLHRLRPDIRAPARRRRLCRLPGEVRPPPAGADRRC